MRTATHVLCVLLLLPAFAACAPSGNLASDAEQRRAARARGIDVEASPDEMFALRQIRADSLLSLPPDSLTGADTQWLLIYMQERERRNDEALTNEVRQSRTDAGKWIIGSTVAAAMIGLISFLVIQKQTDDILNGN